MDTLVFYGCASIILESKDLPACMAPLERGVYIDVEKLKI